MHSTIFLIWTGCFLSGPLLPLSVEAFWTSSTVIGNPTRLQMRAQRANPTTSLASSSPLTSWADRHHRCQHGRDQLLLVPGLRCYLTRANGNRLAGPRHFSPGDESFACRGRQKIHLVFDGQDFPAGLS